MSYKIDKETNIREPFYHKGGTMSLTFKFIKVFLILTLFMIYSPFAIDLSDSVSIKVNNRLEILEPEQRCATCHDLSINIELLDFIKNNCNGDFSGDFVFRIDNPENDLSIYNGNSYTIISRDLNRSVLRGFEIQRSSDEAIHNYLNIKEGTDAWWRRNQSVNYMPLNVNLINYKLVEFNQNDSSCYYTDQAFFSVLPYRGHLGSQIAVFGFQNEFFHTNTTKTIIKIVLDVNGKVYTINNAGYAIVGFASAGMYAINAQVTFSDNTSLKSSFNLDIQHYPDNTWFNSKLNEIGQLDFSIQ